MKSQGIEARFSSEDSFRSDKKDLFQQLLVVGQDVVGSLTIKEAQ